MRYQVQPIRGGYIVTDGREHVGADNFWTRKPENATPFKSERDAQSVAEKHNRR
jgi:hypothetical protein